MQTSCTLAPWPRYAAFTLPWTVHVKQAPSKPVSVIVALKAGVGLVTTSGGLEPARSGAAVRRQSATALPAFFARMFPPSLRQTMKRAGLVIPLNIVLPRLTEKVRPSRGERQDRADRASRQCWVEPRTGPAPRMVARWWQRGTTGFPDGSETDTGRVRA